MIKTCILFIVIKISAATNAKSTKGTKGSKKSRKAMAADQCSNSNQLEPQGYILYILMFRPRLG